MTIRHTLTWTWCTQNILKGIHRFIINYKLNWIIYFYIASSFITRRKLEYLWFLLTFLLENNVIYIFHIKVSCASIPVWSIGRMSVRTRSNLAEIVFATHLSDNSRSGWLLFNIPLKLTGLFFEGWALLIHSVTMFPLSISLYNYLCLSLSLIPLYEEAPGDIHKLGFKHYNSVTQ